MPRSTKIRSIPCPFANRGCNVLFTNKSGLTNHLRTHRRPAAAPATSPTPTSPHDGLPFQGPDEDSDVEMYPAEPDGTHQGPTQENTETQQERILHHPLINGSYFPAFFQVTI